MVSCFFVSPHASDYPYGEGGKKISSSDIYQSFLYGFALANQVEGAPRAGILFPALGTATSPHLEIRQIDGPTAAQLTGISVELVGMQAAIGSDLLWQNTLHSIRVALNELLELN